MQADEERQWVDKARACDPEAIGWLYERYVDRIYNYAWLRVRDPTEAEDITGQVFLKMMEAIGSFEWRGVSFSTWLYRIAHNQVIDALRRHSRRPQVSIDGLGDALVSEGEDPQDLAEQSVLLDHLSEALQQLTDLQAQVISLKYAGGLSNAEVAQILDKTENAINSAQFQALRNLNKLLALKGYKP